MPWTEEIIETERLRLRAAQERDKPTIVALVTDPAVRGYLGGPVPAEQAEAIRRATVGERWGAFCVADRLTDEAIGSVRFGHEHGELEVSYDLLPGSWGKGYATEGVSAALDWAWEHTEDASVTAVTQSANEPSLRLLARLGFEREAEFEQFGAMQARLRLARPVADPI